MVAVKVKKTYKKRGRKVLPELFHGIWKAFSDVVDVLVGLIVVLLHGRRGWVELAVL